MTDPVDGGFPPADPQAKLRVWGKICHHTDGLAIGPVALVLAESGLLDALRATEVAQPVTDLADRFGLRPGYLHVGLRLLALLGLLTWQRAGDGGYAVALTHTGRGWARFAPLYAAILPAINRAERLLGGHVAGVAPPAVTAPLAAHLMGPEIAAIMTRMEAALAWGSGPDKAVAIDALPFAPAERLSVAEWLAALGWAFIDGGCLKFTGDGVIAADMASQYFYSASYLSTSKSIPALLRGQAQAEAAALGAAESHVDRALDIAFSGKVFSATSREPMLELVLPSFDTPDLATQPKAIIDTGCGDATLLIELYQAIAASTARGGGLDQFPLLMVGVDYTPVACQVARDRLGRAGLPYLVVEGDIGDPDGLAATLMGHGIDMRDALHVSKSVIHNRGFRPPASHNRLAVETDAVFVAPDGALIAPQDMLDNLVEHFERWKPWILRHGMISIEAHTVAPLVAAPFAGYHLFASLDANHGFSHQYLVEIDVHRAAALAAGYRLAESRDIGKWMVGRPYMSLDYWTV